LKTGRFLCLGVAAMHFWGVAAPLESWGQQPEGSGSWPERLQAGSLAYENLEFAEASRILKEIIAGLVDGKEGKDSVKILAPAYLYLGMVYLAEGLESLAGKQFESAVLLSPGLSLDSKLFPPAIISGFNQAKLRVDARGRVNLAVETHPPGAEIFLDGRSLGKSPVSCSVIPGIHYLWVEVAGLPSQGRRMELKLREDAREFLELGPVRGENISFLPGTGKTTWNRWSTKKKAVIIGGSALILATAVSVILICTLTGQGSAGETGEIFIKW